MTKNDLNARYILGLRTTQITQITQYPTHAYAYGGNIQLGNLGNSNNLIPQKIDKIDKIGDNHILARIKIDEEIDEEVKFKKNLKDFGY
jgi:hypothetical protein